MSQFLSIEKVVWLIEFKLLFYWSLAKLGYEIWLFGRTSKTRFMVYVWLFKW